jgi:predicted regulator of Ras-like GTPase activity (Roadblock/LC7/MglB family)
MPEKARKEGALVSLPQRLEQDVNWLITNFADRVPSIAHAIVVSSDGLPMAFSQNLPTDRVDQLAAVTSGLTA